VEGRARPPPGASNSQGTGIARPTEERSLASIIPRGKGGHERNKKALMNPSFAQHAPSFLAHETCLYRQFLGVYINNTKDVLSLIPNDEKCIVSWRSDGVFHHE